MCVYIDICIYIYIFIYEKVGLSLIPLQRNCSSVPLCVCMYACVLVAQLCPTLCNPMDCSPPPLSMGFSRQEYWSGLPCPPPGNLSDPGIKPRSPISARNVPSGEAHEDT